MVWFLNCICSVFSTNWSTGKQPRVHSPAKKEIELCQIPSWLQAHCGIFEGKDKWILHNSSHYKAFWYASSGDESLSIPVLIATNWLSLENSFSWFCLLTAAAWTCLINLLLIIMLLILLLWSSQFLMWNFYSSSISVSVLSIGAGWGNTVQ